MSQNRQTILRVEGLSKNYGAFEAVKKVSFSIEEGEVFGLLGPNGAGKTTIISSIVTLVEPTEGSITVGGVDLKKEPDKAKESIGFVPQELIHYGFFNVLEILRYHASYYGVVLEKKRLEDLLDKVGLWEHRKKMVSQLSGGMKRRLLLVKALLHRPKLFLLDEPTAGVDVELRETLWKFILGLKEEGMSILLTTHYLEEAERLCDRVGILHHGKIKRVDRTETLLKEHSSKRVTVILSHPIERVVHPLLKNQGDYHLDFSMPNEMPLLQVLEEGNIPLQAIRDVNVKVGTLRDVMENVLNL